MLKGTCKHGVEDGIVVRRKDGGFSMVAAEMYADPMVSMGSITNTLQL